MLGMIFLRATSKLWDVASEADLFRWDRTVHNAESLQAREDLAWS